MKSNRYTMLPVTTVSIVDKDGKGVFTLKVPLVSNCCALLTKPSIFNLDMIKPVGIQS